MGTAAAIAMLRQSMGDGAKATGFGALRPVSAKHHLKKKKTGHVPNSETQYTDATTPTFQRTYSTLTGDAPTEVIDRTTDTVPVSIRAIVNGISGVDAFTQPHFDIEIFVEMAWLLHKPLEDVVPEEEWFPPLHLINCIYEHGERTGRVKIDSEITLEDNSKAVVMLKSLCVRGTFSCHFELRNFPYDRQTIYVHGVCYSAAAEVVVADPANLPDTACASLMRVRDSNGTKIRKSFSEQKLPLPKITKLGGSRAKVAPLAQVKRIGGAVEFHAWEGASVVKTTNFSLRDTWVLSPTLVVRTGETNPSEAEDGKLFPIVDLGLYMRRRPRYYMWNVVFPTYLYVAISFSSVLVDPLDFQARSEITLAMLLTSTAFKFVVMRLLPEVTYLQCWISIC